MKKYMLLLFCFLMPMFVFGVKKELKLPMPDSIVFTHTTHHFGVIKKGSDGTCEFSFINKGKSVLIVNKVVPSCGCTSVEFTKMPLQSGEKGFVKIVYDTRILGAFNKNITVYSNASNSPEILTINGKVVKK